jgi:adenylate kinase
MFFGIVGSGKGTQAELLEKYLKGKSSDLSFVHAATGAKFRDLIASGNYTSRLILDNQVNGRLQPDFLTDAVFVKILLTELGKDSVLITDGYPRTIHQSEVFDQAMKFYQRGDIAIIYIEVGKEEAIKRMKLRGRTDDTDEGIAKRFDEYVNNVMPAMNYFKDKPGYTIYTINGEQSVEGVHKELIAKLGF